MKFRDACIIRVFDFLCALVLLPFALLIFILILIPQFAVFRKVFYFSQRIGRGGRPFTYVKLMSMYNPEQGKSSARSVLGRAHLETGRTPPWGHFLRKTHIDEIPEIPLVLIGRESFVGPRPLLAEHTALVDSPGRRSLKTGWTGFSQIFLKRRGLLPSRIQRRLDIKLSRELSPRLYFKLIFATLAALPAGHGPLYPGPTVRAYRNAVMENK